VLAGLVTATALALGTWALHYFNINLRLPCPFVTGDKKKKALENGEVRTPHRGPWDDCIRPGNPKPFRHIIVQTCVNLTCSDRLGNCSRQMVTRPCRRFRRWMWRPTCAVMPRRASGSATRSVASVDAVMLALPSSHTLEHSVILWHDAPHDGSRCCEEWGENRFLGPSQKPLISFPPPETVFPMCSIPRATLTHHWWSPPQAAQSLHSTGCLYVRDFRVKEEDNGRFLDLLERYFAASDGQRDARPQYAFQVTSVADDGAQSMAWCCIQTLGIHGVDRR
jgi:hypothetical protein